MMTTTTTADEFVSYTETFFRESDHVIALIGTLQTDAHATSEIERTLSKYQEQPHLLDSHLSTMIDTLFNKSHNAPPQSLSPSAWRVAYTLMRVRGAKVVWKFLPHDVHLLVPLLDFVESPSDDWHARFVALYWLAVLVLVPFRFHVIAESHTDIDVRVRAILQCRLADAGPTREAAAFLAAQWLARGDSPTSMTDFLHWCIANVADAAVDEHLRCGVLRALANVCRFAQRPIVARVADRLLGVALVANETATDSQRLLLKVIQRATLALMPLASAGADSGIRVRRLFASAPSDERTESSGSSVTVVEAELPAQLEAVLDILIRNVASQTGSARWMAAKGIARLCARLPTQLVVEVSEAALFGGGDGDGDRPAALHGACLLLAELLRRGVLPAQLRERALREIAARGVLCDQRRAAASVGSAARDAAAYAMWAAARAIPPSTMTPLLVNIIAPSMAVMAVCDREVNCRRAAAAALQENIGRHGGGGSFPNGIAIVTLLDFYTVGNAASCARSLLPQMAVLAPSLFDALLAHLVERMSRHWHVEQRTLCADAIGLMAQLRPDAVIASAAPVLVERARKAADFVDRHGALLALACICSAIAGDGEALPNSASSAPASSEKASTLLTLCEALPCECAQPAAMRAPGAPLVVGAAARLAGAVAALDRCGATRLLAETRRTELVSVARVALSSNDADCRNAGAAAVENFVALASDAEGMRIAQSFVEQLEDERTLMDAQCGACIVLAALPASCFADVSRVFGAVRNLTTRDRVDCAVRAQACATLGALMTRHFATREEIVSADALLAENLGALNRATLDRTIDAHGDVGAQVREAALDALAAFAKRWLADNNDSTLGAGSLRCVRQFATELPEHCFDRINRGRAAACVHFSELAALHQSPLPTAEPAVRAVVAAAVDSNGWSAAAYAVPLFVPLVVCDSLAPSTLRGIATALVGATRSLAEQVQSSLEAYLPSLDDRDLLTLCNGLSAALTGALDTRTRPAFWRLATLVLEFAPAANTATVAPLCDVLCTNVVSEFGRTRTFAVARSALPLLAAIALRASDAARQRALRQLMILLACSWPVVRRETAEFLLEKVLAARAADDSAIALLRSTAWDSETLERVRIIRNEVCAALNIGAILSAPSSTL
jgi:hypothetical protein